MLKSILYVATNEIQLLDLPKRLDEMGYSVYVAILNIAADRYDEAACKRLEEVIVQYAPDCVISYDFVESISRACLLRDVAYIAWVYDSPQKELYTKDAFNPCNYIVVFDKIQQKRLLDIGLDHVLHEPLAIHAGKIVRDLDLIDENDDNYDISFVGQLYKYDYLDKIVHEAPLEIREELDTVLNENFLRWGDNSSIYDTISENAISYLVNSDNKVIYNVYPYMTESFFYESAVLSRVLANRERVHIINTLADIYNMSFFTFDKDLSQLNDKVIIHPGAKYDYEVSKIYNKSRINLNITLHSIETGACQRVFDVMGAGGFLISNYQKELTELFEEDNEIVLFRNEKELLEKINYYLNHEDERKLIAMRGQRKVLRMHDFSNGLERVLQCVESDFKTKKESYIDITRRKIYKIADGYLRDRSINSLGRLTRMMNEPKYETVISRTTQLETLKTISNLSQKADPVQLFSGISSVEEASDLYIKIKHFSWRCESDIDSDSLGQIAEELLKQNEYMILWAMIIYSDVDKIEDTTCKIADIIKDIKPIKALGLVEAMIFLLPDCQKLSIKSAEILLQYGDYKGAHSALMRIKNPGIEIKELINQLERVIKENGNVKQE